MLHRAEKRVSEIELRVVRSEVRPYIGGLFCPPVHLSACLLTDAGYNSRSQSQSETTMDINPHQFLSEVFVIYGSIHIFFPLIEGNEEVNSRVHTSPT